MRKFKAGLMQATESMMATIALDGISDARRAAQRPADGSPSN